jgi:L-alanine-DL-glutamate epimerase-like enolase superfamily enzyme
VRITDVTVVLHERSASGAASFGPAGRRIPLVGGAAEDAEGNADEAVYRRDQGWRGYKLHPPRGPWLPPGESPPVGFDIEACAAVRAAVGDDMTLMLDSS